MVTSNSISFEVDLTTYGFCHIPNKNEIQLAEILAQFGNIIHETDVIANSESKSLVTSNKQLDFHTDNHLAKYILWHCKKQAEEGGISMLCDAADVYSKLNEDEKVALSNIHVYEHKMFPENRNSNPIVSEENGEVKFYYSFWLARKKYRELPVFQKWRNLIENAKKVELRLETNDILIIDNHRMLHGRSEIKGERFLKRYWIHPTFQPTKTLYSQT